MLELVRDRLDNTLVSSIEPEVWERIRSMEAGQNEHGYDPFGFNPESLKYIVPLAVGLYRHYFRVEAYGIDGTQRSIMLRAMRGGRFSTSVAVAIIIPSSGIWPV